MKKLIMVVVAIAMVVAFLPVVEAGESAQLGLTVTFKANEPLTISTWPVGPFSVDEGNGLYITVTAQDPDATMVTLKCGELPAGATFVVDERNYSATYISGTFSWPTKMGQSQDLPYKVVFTATSELKNAEDGTVKTEEAQLVAEITVKHVEPVISIELYPLSWNLDGVKLGELRTNYYWGTRPMHYISNRGNVQVLVEIGYGPQTDNTGTVHPGEVQGLDTFTTAVGLDANGDGKGVIIPPNGRVQAANIATNSSAALWLTYGAPTKLSDGISKMSAAYELRATAAIKDGATN